MYNYRKCKAQENKTPQASTSTDPTPSPIIYSHNQANEYLQKNFIGNPFGYDCDICDRLWYMNNFKQVNKNTCVLDPEFPDMDVAQFKAYVTCTVTTESDKVPTLSSSKAFTYPPYSTHLPPLDCICERVVAPKFPFMQNKRLKHQMGGTN
jgi:hypothetical protein